jgi:hypothetical protein
LFGNERPSRPKGEASGGRFADNGLEAKMQTLLILTIKNEKKNMVKLKSIEWECIECKRCIKCIACKQCIDKQYKYDYNEEKERKR